MRTIKFRGKSIDTNEWLYGDLDQELRGDCRTDLFAKVIGNIHDNSELMKGFVE